MFSLQLVSIWASKHVPMAIALIVLLELANIAIGITVGHFLLGSFSSFTLCILLAGLIFFRKNLLQYAYICFAVIDRSKYYGFRQKVIFGLFCINLLGYTLSGAIMEKMVVQPSATNSLYGTMYLREQKSKLTAWHTKKHINQEDTSKQTGRRIGYILLFVAGIIFAYSGTYLACALACSNQGFLAVIVALLSLGVLAAGFYFLGRGIDKNMKPYKEMTPAEHKREKRRYFRTLLGTVVGILLLILLSSLR